MRSISEQATSAPLLHLGLAYNSLRSGAHPPGARRGAPPLTTALGTAAPVARGAWIDTLMSLDLGYNQLCDLPETVAQLAGLHALSHLHLAVRGCERCGTVQPVR